MRSTAVWIKLKNNLPSELKELCILCYEFYELANHVEKISPYITGFDIEKVQSSVQRIMSEYLRILRQEGITEEQLIEVQSDITKHLSTFYEPKTGVVRPLTAEFKQAKKDGVLDMHFPLFMAPFTSYVDSRILDSLLEAHKKSQVFLLANFVTSTARKSGLAPTFDKEGLLVAPLRRKRSSMEEDDDVWQR